MMAKRCRRSAIPFPAKPSRQRQKLPAVLGLQVGDRVIHVKRLLRFSGDPVVFDQIYLVADLFPGLTLEGLRGGDRSLYSLFENDYGVRMINAEEHLRAVAADARARVCLASFEGDPLLLVERTAYTYGNKPVEWRRGLVLHAASLLSERPGLSLVLCELGLKSPTGAFQADFECIIMALFKPRTSG
jgi:DNA-binding GntR family transcriptional regulator